MKHPSNLSQYLEDPNSIERGELIEVHLEECERCRRLLTPVKGVDLDRVALGLGAEINPAPSGKRWLSGLPGPAIAAAAFVLVLATGALALWFTSPDSEPAPPADAPTTTVAPVETVAAPVAFADRQSFELIWELDSGDVGQFLWIADERYRATRLTPTPENGVLTRYYAGKDVTESFWDTNDDLLGTAPDGSWTVDGEGDGAPRPPDLRTDAAIPYALLLEPTTVQDWPTVLGGSWAVSAEQATPTHPEATSAWTAGDHRIEIARNSSSGVAYRTGTPSNANSIL